MITILGGVISKQKGNSVTFKLQCEKCGHLDHPELTITVTKGITEVTTQNCLHCGQRQQIKMRHLLN